MSTATALPMTKEGERGTERQPGAGGQREEQSDSLGQVDSRRRDYSLFPVEFGGSRKCWIGRVEEML